jgi:hypothetical protein
VKWAQRYPTVGAVAKASLETLRQYDTNLPEPTTDVERTVRKRITRRIDDMTAQQVREQSPDVADAFNRIFDKLADKGVKVPGARRF